MQQVTNRRPWEGAHREALAIWRLIRSEAGPGWTVGLRDAKGIAWYEADLS
jgi:hypothetical protein